MASRPTSNLLNWLLVPLLLVTAWRVVAQQTAASPSAGPTTPLLEQGSRLTIPGFRWAPERKHVVLLLDVGCHACQVSAPFYSRLVKRSAVRSYDFVVLSADGRQHVLDWLRTHGLAADHIVPIDDPARLGFSDYPTLLLTQADGTITDIVQGSPSEDTQALLASRLDSPESTAPVKVALRAREISEAVLLAEQQRAPVQVIDVRERPAFRAAHRADTRNIPLDELAIRDKVELSPAIPVAVDCSREVLVRCRNAGAELLESGFATVWVVVPDRR